MPPLTVLLVEDSENDAKLIVRQLEKAAFSVVFERVETPTEMKASIQNKMWDIIIADYQLPEFNAAAALDLLQETGLDIPFIVVSGAIGEETAVGLLRSGAKDYLMKGSLARLGLVVERELNDAFHRREQKKIEDLLRLQSTALNAAANAIVITNRDGIIEWVNQAFFSLTGFNAGEAIGKNIHQLLNSGLYDQSFYRQLWKTILDGKVWHGEITNRRKNRRLYTEEQTITPLRGSDGEITQFIMIKMDITQRKRMEKELRLWADAFKYCAHGIALANPTNNKLLIYNPAFAEMHKATINEFIGQPGFPMFAPGAQKSIEQYVEIADKEGHVQFEAVRLKKDGATFPAQLDLVSVRDSNGTLLYRIASIQDISKRKKAEQALVKKMEESQQRAHELEIITEVSASLRLTQTRPEIVQTILQKIIELFNAQCAALALIEKGNLIFNVVSSGAQFNQSLQSLTEKNVFSKVIQSGKPLIVTSIDAVLKMALANLFGPCFKSASSLIIYPLKNDLNTIGLVSLAYESPAQILPGQLTLVTAVAEMASNALNRMAVTEELENMVNRREQELGYIYQVTSAASKWIEIRQALQEALELTLNAIHSEMGGIYLLDETDGHPELIVHQGVDQTIPEGVRHGRLDNFLGEIIRNKKTIVIPDLMANSKVLWSPDPHKALSFIGQPMLNQEHVIGIIAIVREVKDQINVEEMTLLSFIADHLALVVENTRLYKSAEHSAVMQERSRLARELHDSVTQSLFSANLYAAGAKKSIEQLDYSKTEIFISQISILTQQSLRDMRLLVYELRNDELLGNGLLSALQSRLDAVERRSGIQAEIKSDWINPVPQRIEDNLYRITIEALNNSLKHAQAAHLWIELSQEKDQVTLQILDDGVGFISNSSTRKGGMGLTTMRERCEMISGSFRIESSPGNGTKIRVQIPMSNKSGEKEEKIESNNSSFNSR